MEVFISKINDCIFEIKMESLVIYKMRLFKTLLFNLESKNTYSCYFGVVSRKLLNFNVYNLYHLIQFSVKPKTLLF